jgi:hypothetical protein
MQLYGVLENSVSYQGIAFSDAESPPKSVAPLGAGRQKFIFSAICSAAAGAPSAPEILRPAPVDCYPANPTVRDFKAAGVM